MKPLGNPPEIEQTGDVSDLVKNYWMTRARPVRKIRVTCTLIFLIYLICTCDVNCNVLVRV